ncbi:MAG: MBOAT family protein [Oscillospiraceae bacterium]|nr:MBOAT family protein [Oscillospiraceae bacterium]
MVFSSLVFLCIFLPVVLILHSAVGNRKVKNGLLLAASLLFYAYGEPVYVLLMLLSALYNYLFALLLSKRRSKCVLASAIAVNIGILCVFKYTGFLVSNLNNALGLAFHVPEIALPIGISFFTFQALSYVIDVYRGEVAVQRNYFKVLLYISLFPQLIAGPIVRYRDIEREIDNRTVTLGDAAVGMRRFIAGLGKKVLIANAMGAAADHFFNGGAANLNIIGAWMGAVAYLMQIYFDFSGYSDMAIGLGRMFGFHFKENFNHPYISSTMQEFWRRWHISLSSWFRDYVYIPLGGNRKGKVRTVINRIIVFFLTGLWHGANWTFVIWGLFHGFFLLLEEAVPKLKKLPGAILHIYTLLAVTVGFVIFRADTLGDAFVFIGRMFAGFDFSRAAVSHALTAATPWFFTMLAAAVICCGPFEKLTRRISGLEGKGELTGKESIVRTGTFVLAAMLLMWCVIRLAGAGYNPFIYFRF